MDLLIRWLGKGSVRQAKKIRAVHSNYLERGPRIWNRLEETYGSLEMIEDALFKQVDNFPRMFGKDFSKLREFNDILIELQSAKEDGDLSGLGLLDNASGVNPLVKKLPFNLQEK